MVGEEVGDGRIVAVAARVAVAGIFVGASADGVGDMEVGVRSIGVLVGVLVATGDVWVGAALVGVIEAEIGVDGGVVGNAGAAAVGVIDAGIGVGGGTVGDAGSAAVGVIEAGIAVGGGVAVVVAAGVRVGLTELNWMAPISRNNLRGLPKKSLVMPRSMAPPPAKEELPGE